MLKEKIYKMDYYSEKILTVLLLIFEYIAIIVAEKISLIIQNNIPYTAGKFYIPDIYFYLVIPAIYIFFVEHTKVNERFIFFLGNYAKNFLCCII